MGLGVAVGMRSELEGDPEGLASFEAQLAVVNLLLQEHGHPVHQEGVMPEGAQSRAMCDSFPYGFIHHLRHAYAWARQRPGESLPGIERLGPAENARLEHELGRLESHLLVHSDAEGLYVPVDFDEPLCDPRLPGGMLGSTVRLKRELMTIAPLLGVTVVAGELDDGAMAGLDVEDDDPHHREKTVFATLWEACRLSLAHRVAIVFC